MRQRNHAHISFPLTTVIWSLCVMLLISVIYSGKAFAYEDPQLAMIIDKEYSHCEVIPHASVFSSPFVDELAMYNVCVGEVLEKIHKHITEVKAKYPHAYYAVLGADYKTSHKRDIGPTIAPLMKHQMDKLPGFHIVGRDICLYAQADEHKGTCYRVLLK